MNSRVLFVAWADWVGVGVQSVLSGLTLEQCLDAYTREETLEEEDSWYCSSCQAHRRGVMKIDLWKMPDVLVSHVMSCHVVGQPIAVVGGFSARGGWHGVC